MRFISVLLSVFCIMPFTYADVLVTQDDNAALVISIKGQITKSDLAAMIDKASGGKHNLLGLILDSPGGDLETALKMGTFIRSKNFDFVFVPENAGCFSSCVFLLAGGTKRMVAGDVGIHRPFSVQDDITTEKGQKAEYKRLEAMVKSYLKKVNIPTDLYDEMMRISPADMRILTEAELKHFGLSEDDPYIKEAEVTRLAHEAGLTKKQYYEREAKMKQCYGLSYEIVQGGISGEVSQCIQKVLEEPLK